MTESDRSRYRGAKPHGSRGSARLGAVGVSILAGLMLVPSLDAVGRAGKADLPKACLRVEMKGMVRAGEGWQAAIGQGWVFRMVPIPPSGKGYTGWDLVMDREMGGGYPDALLLATPPYGSLSEREIGTTFGLRAQDAIAWGPRRFHFLTSPEELARGRMLYETLMHGGAGGKPEDAGGELLEMVKDASAGELRIEDAELAAGTADPAPFAQQWALHLRQVPHTLLPVSAAATPRGELRSMRFAVKLWLPAGWKVAPEIHAERASCSQ